MKDQSSLPGMGTAGAMPLRRDAARPRIRNPILLAMVVCAAARGPCAAAADETLAARLDADPFGLSATSMRLRSPWIAPGESRATPASFDFSLPASQTYSSVDFRPRKRTLFDADVTPGNPYVAKPMLLHTTVWQRLSEYRSRDRVRLLTLWETPGSSVSLQAGRRGDPSLQWSSRVMNRGGATRGLFDRLLSVSFGSGGGHSRNAARSLASVSPSASPPLLPPVASAIK